MKTRKTSPKNKSLKTKPLFMRFLEKPIKIKTSIRAGGKDIYAAKDPY